MSGFDWQTIVNAVSVWAVPLLLAITLHEAGHALAAKRLGDTTASDQGRVTLNPLKHIDPFGTILLPLLLLFAKAPFLFGYARPVPVRYERLNTLPRDIAIVAAAGPAANLLLIILSALLFNFGPLLPASAQEIFARNIVNSIGINTVLMVFNLFPIPPLDGSKILMVYGPASLGRAIFKFERYGMLFILALLMLMPLMTQMFGFNPIGEFFRSVLSWMFHAVEPLMGLFRWFQ